MQFKDQTITVKHWHGKGESKIHPADLVSIVRTVVRASSKNDLRLIEEAATLELRRRAELDRKSLEGLLDSRRRKALRCAKHQAKAKAADLRRAQRKAEHIARASGRRFTTPRDYEMVARERMTAEDLRGLPYRLDESAQAFAHAFGI